MTLRRVGLVLVSAIALLCSSFVTPAAGAAQVVTVLFQARFDSGPDGFVYQDDPFGTEQPFYASGGYLAGGGYSGGGLQVVLGGLDGDVIHGMSGGWTYTLNLPAAATGVALSLRYRMTTPTDYEYDEYSRVLVSVDGTLYGRGAKEYLDHIGGDGDDTGPATHDTLWQSHQVYLGSLAAGTHTLIIGACNNKKDAPGESTIVVFDDVVLTSGNPEPATTVAQTLVDRLSLAQFKADLQTVAGLGDRCRLIGCEPYSTYRSAQNWVESQLLAMGYTPVRHNYTYDGQTGTNLWVTKVGTAHPEAMYLVTAHLDGQGGGGAADDNGSGVSLVLNVARIFAAADVTTDYSLRFIFWDQEELEGTGSRAYVSERNGLRGLENPPGSGQYPEPDWLGHLTHDMILYDHGVGTAGAEQSAYADLDVEWRDGTAYATESMSLALTWRFLSGTYAADYPANAANFSADTDDAAFHNYCPAVSIRENRRSVPDEWVNPNYHKPTDTYSSYLEADYRLGFNALQATVGVLAKLARARIAGANVAPAAQPQWVSTAEDTPRVITLTGSDPDGDEVTFRITQHPSHGILSGTAPVLTYSPAADYYGADSFGFVVNDGRADSTPAMVDITIQPVNDAPVADSQFVEMQLGTPVAITLTGSDVDGDPLIFIVRDGPRHGVLSGTPPHLVYTPGSSFASSDSFTFVVNDGQVDSAVATVSIATKPVAVEIVRFEAVVGWGYTELRWATASEVNNLGFNLHRGLGRDGPLQQINAELITSRVPPGNPLGAAYSFRDRSVMPNRTYSYWLEALDVYGRTEWHGPLTVKVTRWLNSPAVLRE